MTMTMINNEPMTIEDEERLLIDKLLSASHAVELHKAAMRDLRVEQIRLEKHEAECKQAVEDYCRENGVTQFETNTHTCSISTTLSVDVPDVEAVPVDYQRVKTVIEPNKILIGEAYKAGKLPAANWFHMAQSTKITVRSK
jgi:hypothetical protein